MGQSSGHRSTSLDSGGGTPGEFSGESTFQSLAIGVGQNEESVSSVRGTGIGRSNSSPLRIEPEAGKAVEQAREAALRGEGAHVLQDDDAGSHRANGVEEDVQEVPVVPTATSRSRGGVGLTRDAPSDDVHSAAKELSREGLQIVPDRCGRQGRFRHPLHEGGRGKHFPFDVTHRPGAEDAADCEVQSSDPRAHGEEMKMVMHQWPVQSAQEL